MKLRHLEVFVSLCETRILTAAAAQLHMTQPAISHWLADIEDVMGCPLFLRGRRLELTEVGRVLLAHAHRMLGDVQRTSVELQAVQAGMKGRLRVGTTVPSVLLPKAVTRLQATRPGILVSVVESSLTHLLGCLSRREMDTVIAAMSPQAHNSGFTTETLIEDGVRIVARSGHPLLESTRPRWSDATRYPWIMPPRGSVMWGCVEAAFADQGIAPPTPRVEASSSLRVQFLLAGARDNLSVLTASEVRLYKHLGVIESVDLWPAIPFPDIGVIWSPDNASATVENLLEALRAEALSQ